MSRTTIAVSKFVGTISLGLLTGLSYTLTTTTLPPLLALPTATPAHTTFRRLRALTAHHQLLLSTLSASFLLLAYTLSPPRGKHPYLLWSVLAIGLGFGKDWAEVLGIFGKRKAVGEGKGKGKERREVEDGDWELEGSGEGVNGEVLREGMEGWRGRQMVKGAVWGLAWGVSVVGLWGDGL